MQREMENVLQEAHGSLAPSSQHDRESPGCRSGHRPALPERRAPSPWVGHVLSGTKHPALTVIKLGMDFQLSEFIQIVEQICKLSHGNMLTTSIFICINLYIYFGVCVCVMCVVDTHIH